MVFWIGVLVGGALLYIYVAIALRGARTGADTGTPPA